MCRRPSFFFFSPLAAAMREKEEIMSRSSSREAGPQRLLPPFPFSARLNLNWSWKRSRLRASPPSERPEERSTSPFSFIFSREKERGLVRSPPRAASFFLLSPLFRDLVGGSRGLPLFAPASGARTRSGCGSFSFFSPLSHQQRRTGAATVVVGEERPYLGP